MSQTISPKAIILFSGGLDSTTCFALAKAQGFDCYALSFLYQQKHEIEVERAKIIAKKMGAIEHLVLPLPLDLIKGSSLTDKNLAVPDHQNNGVIPSTYVPMRNTIFLSLAVAWGEVIGGYDIFFGANYVDYSGYPDCRPAYIEAFERMANLGSKAGVEGQQFHIHAPLLQWNKAEIIRQGNQLGINYAETISCYRADSKGHACGTCDSCTYRKKGFLEANIPDPTIYF